MSTFPEGKMCIRPQQRLWLGLFLGAIFAGPSIAEELPDYASHREPALGNTFAYSLGNGGTINAKWSSKVMKWYYNPSSQPADLSTEQIVATIQNAMGRWRDVCDIAFSYLGETTVAPDLEATFSSIDRISVIGWGPLTGTRARFAAYTSWWYLNSGTMVDADMVINTTAIQPFDASRQFELEALMVHEVGHLLGINHSNVSFAVMYANPYNPYKFQRTLRGDDAAACTQIYGASAQVSTNRVFNWAEVTYENYFAPVGGVSYDLSGYLVRAYANTGSYVGAKDGTVFVLLPGGPVTPVGQVGDFLPQAIQAGF